MIIDPAIDNVAFEPHVGSDISGQADPLIPTRYGSRKLTDATEMYIEGTSYRQWLAAIHRPVMANTGKLALCFDIMFDSNYYLMSQANEFDTKLAIGGFVYNFSSQFNNLTGIWQITRDGQGWQDTGFKVGRFTPDIWYAMRFDYSFDVAKKLYSFVKLKVGVKEFSVPTYLQNMAAKASNWQDSCNFQLQQDLNVSGGAYSIFIKKDSARYEWS